MTTERQVKTKLSKSIMEMKFMKKSKDRVTKEQDEEEARALFASEVTEAMRVGGNKFVLEPSFVPCEGLIVGRLSYHGMNPEIENLLEQEKESKNKEGNKEKKVDADVEISDAEMARRYMTLIGTISNKFKTKKQKRPMESEPSRKRTKFIKPKDD